MTKINKPKINGKEFLKAIESAMEVLQRKTTNGSTQAENEVYGILSEVHTKAYLIKKF